MPTKTYTFNFGTSDYALTDRGLTGSITYARDGTDNAAKFTCTTKSMSATAESGWGAATGVTWETWVGLPAITVTNVQVTAWSKKLVANTKLGTTNTVKMRILSGTTTVHSAGELINAALATTPTDGDYVAQSAGTQRAVDAGYQAGTTEVRFELELTLATTGSGGSASVDERFDGIEITITYTANAQTLTLPYIDNSADTLYDQTVAPGAVTITTGSLTNTSVLYDQTLVNIQTLVVPYIDLGNTLYDQTVTPGAVTIVTGSLENASILYDQTLAPGAVTIVTGSLENLSVLYNQTVIPQAPPILLTNAGVRRRPTRRPVLNSLLRR